MWNSLKQLLKIIGWTFGAVALFVVAMVSWVVFELWPRTYEIEISLKDQNGVVIFSQRDSPLPVDDYYYYRYAEFTDKDGNTVKVKIEPALKRVTNIIVSSSGSVIRFQDKYDTAWIDTRNMCGNAIGNLEATLPEKKCQEDFSRITDWQDLGIISDKSSDGLVLVK